MAVERAPIVAVDARTGLDAWLAERPRIGWDTAAVWSLVLVGLVLRFHDQGSRAIHHDESLHALYSWYLYRGQGYIHDPLMHGPLLFHLMALGYWLLGVTDATARFVPSLAGGLLVAAPLLLRERLGRVGTVAAALLICVSPSLLYFSRFVGAGAQDILVLGGMMLVVAGIWRYLDRHQGGDRWLYAVAGGLALSFATKETTYIVAAVLLLWLNGLLACELARRRDRGARAGALATALLFPTAWLVAALWPALGGVRRRLGLDDEALPRAGDVLLVLGLLTAPQFAAAAEIPFLARGVWMGTPVWHPDLTLAMLLGGVTVGLLLAATALTGLAWRQRTFVICAAVFWGIYLPLFTTFFTNPAGFATGIWGSLDYWLVQHGEERGKQPVFYYAMLTAVYEHLPLLLGLAGVGWAAVRGGWLSRAALPAGLAMVLLGVIFGNGGVRGVPFALAALLCLVLALRRDRFRSFVAFWAASSFFAFSVAGEKMPWLETYIALPLILLAALTLNDLWAAGRRALWPATAGHGGRLRAVAVVVAALTGLAAAAAVVWPGDAVARAPVLIGMGGLALVAALLAGVRAPAGAGLALGVAVTAWLLPITVRDSLRAAFEHADTPRDMLIYTQTSPALRQMAGRVDELARASGQGFDLPITIDTGDAFTWPWAWYLRDYRNVAYIDAANIVASPQRANDIRPGAVLITLHTNQLAANAWPGLYGPGERIPHRWWFPEEGYRTTTGPRFWAWLRDPAMWRTWRDFYLDRRTTGRIGSIDAVAFFPQNFEPATMIETVAPTFRPRVEDGRLVLGGAGASAGAFRRPAGVAVDTQGNVYVADSLNNRIQKFSPDGERLAQAGGASRFREPWGIAVAPDGSVYVADTWNHRIVKLDRELRTVATWGGPVQLPRPVELSPFELYGPRGVAVAPDGTIWVTDTGNQRIVVFRPDGEPVAVYGRQGSGPGEFDEPVGIAVTPVGEVVVADAWNGRVQRFSATFEPLGEFSVSGWTGDRNVDNKPYLTVLWDGSIALTLPDGGRIERYRDGEVTAYAWSLTGGGTPRPIGIAMDPKARLWVTDAAASQLVRLPALASVR